MQILDKLNRIRIHQRGHMPYLESLEDYDIVCAIGNAQEARTVFRPGDLTAHQLGSKATVLRRLKRLVELGVVTKAQDKGDGRMVQLRLSREVLKAYAKLGSYLDRLGKA